MPDLKMDAEGYLVDEQGERVLIGEEPVKVTNAQSSENVEKVIKERLARQAEKIKALESQANRTPELEKLIEEERKAKNDLEQQLAKAKEEAQAEVAAQFQKVQKQAEEFRQKYESESQARIRDQVANSILSQAGDRFINPGMDIVPKLLEVHKREPVKDEQGKPIDGKFVDVFTLRYKTEKGEEVEEALPVDKALDVLAGQEAYQHYVKASNNGGSGGGQYTNFGNMKRSSMTPAEKAAFVGKHGQEAFQSLPE